MNLLFVYGTLLQLDNPLGSYLKNNSTWLSAAKFRGLLYDIGEYPGAIFDRSANTKVSGHLFSIANNEQVWNILDEYEGYGIDYPVPNEFIRQLIEVETQSHLIQCWTYLYNLPVNSFTRIESGNYEEYLLKK